MSRRVKFSTSQEMSIEEKQQQTNEKNRIRNKLWSLRIVFFLLLIFIWLMYISPLLGGIEGLLVGALEVINPSVDYYNRNNTKHIVYNSQCNLTHKYTKNSYNIDANNTFNGTCPIAYIFNGTYCVPECIRWNPGGNVYFWIYRISTVVGSAIQIGTCIIFLSAWLQAGRSVWRFPAVTSFYLMITILIQSLAVFSGSLIPERFYCSSQELDRSREASTIACKIQGALFQYGIFSFMLWYLSSFVNLALLVAIPLHTAKIMKHRHKIHVLEFIICFFFPIIVLLISFFADSDGQGYRILNVPEVCLPKDAFIFITIYLPGILFSLILGSLAMLILYKLFTQQFVSSAGAGLKRTIITDLAIQVILFLVSFGFLIWIIMIDFVVYENLKLPYKGFLDEYIRCITDYLGNEACCNAVFQEYYASWLSTLAGFCSTVWAAPALLGLAGRIISQKCCSCVRESHSENRTAITTTNHDRRNELIRGQTLKREENNVGYGNPYPGKIATILTEDSPKVSDKFKKSNTVDDFNEVHH